MICLAPPATQASFVPKPPRCSGIEIERSKAKSLLRDDAAELTSNPTVAANDDVIADRVQGIRELCFGGGCCIAAYGEALDDRTGASDEQRMSMERTIAASTG